jgi:hypothetical protein
MSWDGGLLSVTEEADATIRRSEKRMKLHLLQNGDFGFSRLEERKWPNVDTFDT